MPDVKWNGKWHPYAERFRMRSEAEIRMLAEDIKQNGQAAPCVMTKDGLGLDGRNRVAACRIAGVEPEWVVYEGDNPVARIMSLNLGSRDYTTGQKAMMTAIGLVEQGLRENGRWKRGSVPEAPDNGNSSVIAWGKAVQHAGVILDYRPDLANEVISGNVALSSAYDDACTKRDQDEQYAKQLAKLPADLAALVENGIRDLDDAAKEAECRAKVAEIDEIRDADGAPPPSFAQRVTDGAISWSEAAKLAEEWHQERGKAITRTRERLQRIVSSWGAIWEVTHDPHSPYVADILDGLNDGDRKRIQEIISSLKDGGTPS